MRSKRVSAISGFLFLLAFASGTAFAAQSPAAPCGGQTITKDNSFKYGGLAPTATTFSGSGGNSVTVTFTVTAPSGGDVFPDCNTPDTANLFVQNITQVGDASGTAITPVDIGDTNPSLFSQIAGAFGFSPSSNSFTIGQVLTVTVTVSNPDLTSGYYGDYDIKMAAKETIPSSTGIGVGSGAHFVLSLRAPSCDDTTAPTVTVTQPNGDQILGVIGVTVTAIDPDTPTGCGTGVVSMSANISSAGGAISNQGIDLTPNPSLPVGAGVLVTATGSFTPAGGTGIAGTVNGSPFTSSSLSGIGNYTINAQATDGAGNTGYGNDTFNVKYNVAFTNALVSGGSPAGHCTTAGSPSGNGCQVHFDFTVNRSNLTSDGAFMVDETVVVKLRNTGTNTVVATHSYGCGSPFGAVPISTTTGVACTTGTNNYSTNFKRADFGANAPGTYVAEVYFLNVDGTLTLEGTSSSVTF